MKKAKATQDMRLDVPAIGPNTVNNLIKFKYRGIAIEKDKVIIISPEKTFELLKKHKIFVTFF